VAPTISGTVAGQTTTSEAPDHPFSGVTVGDLNSGATDTLTITLAGSGGTLSGTGLSGSGSTYTLTGSASAVTSALDALTFTPNAGAPNTSSTTTFTLSDTSSAYATPTVDSTTSVIDYDPPQALTLWEIGYYEKLNHGMAPNNSPNMGSDSTLIGLANAPFEEGGLASPAFQASSPLGVATSQSSPKLDAITATLLGDGPNA
jgi:hypothetical protein